jgi:hypothetical protein
MERKGRVMNKWGENTRDWKEDIKDCGNADCKYFNEKEGNNCKIRWDTKNCPDYRELQGKGRVMVDKRALREDLTEAFIQYQYRLDYPFPQHPTTESKLSMIQRYRQDGLFHRKVDTLVAGVIQILDKHI